MPIDTQTPTSLKPSRTRLWLVAGIAVLVLHFGILWSIWQGWGLRPEALTLAEGQFPTEAELTIPITPVKASGIRQQTKPRNPAPAPVSRSATATQADTAQPLASDQAVATPPAQDDPADKPSAAPPEALPTPPALTEAVATHKLPAVKLPDSARLRYEVLGYARGLTFHANATLDWRQDGHRYESRLEIGAFLFGSRVQTSMGQITPEGLRPDRFSDAVRRERRLSFDHETQQLRLDEGNPIPLPPATQDRLSVFLQLAGLLAALPPTSPGQRWQIPVAGLPTIEDMIFVFDGPESLNLPAGQFQTLKLRREARRPGEQRLEIWLAPQYQYLPVRILLQEANGDSADQRLRSR